MTAQLAAYGRLGQGPREIQTRSGKAMAVASLAVDIAREDDEQPLWLGVVAFGKLAELLMRHAKGELVSVAGRLQRNTWTGQDGEAREQLQIVAESLVSARTTRPGGRKKSEAPAEQIEDDAIPF